MTLIQIYNRAILFVFGDSTPTASVLAATTGAGGIIAKSHIDIQTEYDYWFMEEESTQAITSGTSSYTLPTGFKSEIAFRLLYDTGLYKPPLERLGRRQAYNLYLDSNATADYPTRYQIYEDQLTLYPEPSEDSTLHMRYYKYLTALSADTDHDALTDDIHGAEALVSRTVIDICLIVDYIEKAQVFSERYKSAIEKLRQKDYEMKKYGQEYVEYKGL